jgi:NADH-quinone oxidoreductase subunit H
MPRLRYDQFMRLGWKVLIPVSLVWIMIVAGIQVMRSSDLSFTQRVIAIGIGVIVLVALSWPFLFTPETKPEIKPGDMPAQRGGFPVPPMDLTVPPSPRLRRVAGERAKVTVPADDADATDSADTMSGSADTTESEV